VNTTTRSAVLVLAVTAALLLLPGRASAEPQFSVRKGVGCQACHVNQSGGGMRTQYGSSFSQTDLPTVRLKGALNPNLTDWIQLGADIRGSHKTMLATKTKLATEAGFDEWETETTNSFEMPEGNLYLRVQPVPGYLTLYLDETLSPEGASAREAFVMVHDLPGGLFFKAGRFMLPFGLKIRDDEAFIRQQTGFTYADQDLGVEIGISPGPLFWSVAVSNGSGGGADPNQPKQITTRATLTGPWIQGGMSYSFNDTSTDEFRYHAHITGAHLGVRLGRFVLMGEFDWLHGTTDDRPWDQYAVYTEVDFEAIKGVWLKVKWEGYDPLMSLPENHRDRFVFGISWFPVQYVELRAEYRLNRDIPQRIDGNVDEVILELHAFL
jgi:hypothetical protein